MARLILSVLFVVAVSSELLTAQDFGRPTAPRIGQGGAYPSPRQQYVPPSQPQYEPRDNRPPDGLDGYQARLRAEQQRAFSGAARPGPQPAQTPQLNLFQPAQVIARVGDQPIFMGDLLGTINQMLEPYAGKYPEEEIEKQKQVLVKQLLAAHIEQKLLFVEFLREFPQPDKLPEVFNSVYQQFDQSQLEALMTKANVNNPAELDIYLRKYGTSLQKTKRAFAEQAMGQEMLRKHVKFDAEITHNELVEYYNEHLDEFEVEATARWEQLMVRFDKFPDKASAHREIADMGNQVYLGGAPLNAVAKQRSQGIKAHRGGYYDWTTQGSLKSKVLDNAIFSLPPGRLSQILEDEKGFHIIRVTERRDAKRIGFKAPEHVSIVGFRPRAGQAGNVDVVADLTNAGNVDETVELSMYLNVGAHPRFVTSEKVTVPSLGRATAKLTLEGASVKNVPKDKVKLSLEPQDRIRTVIRRARLEEEREAYLAKLRDPNRTKVWTIYDNESSRNAQRPRQDASPSRSGSFSPR